MEIAVVLYAVYETFCRIGRKVIFDHSPLDSNEINELDEIGRKLFKARKLAHGSGERGRLFLYTIAQLDRLRKQLLKIGKARREVPRLFISHATPDRPRS